VGPRRSSEFASHRRIPRNPGADRNRDVAGARALRAATKANLNKTMIEIVNRSAAGVEDDERLQAWRPPRLVLTSPRYAGVHVLYHRWQVDGRKEAPLPQRRSAKLPRTKRLADRPQKNRCQHKSDERDKDKPGGNVELGPR
jgi:hypothetical protein